MARSYVVLICSAAMLALVSVPTSAQQKTIKQCNDEWAANKASIQASGKTKKAFVAECRGQATAATPKPSAASPKPPASAAPSPAANVKTAKQCNDEWAANKSAIQASKKTKKQFLTECRTQPAGAATTTAAPTTASPPTGPPPRTSPATPPSPPRQAPAAQPSAPAASPRTAAAPTAANQFSTEVQAKARCPSDTVVWVNTDSNIYHFATGRNYGKTKSGAYMCERDATASGARAAKNEKHP
jgi:hypothetical protein